MKVDTQTLEHRQLQMTVEVPDEEVRNAMRAAARRLGKRLRIPGFRPGKAPYEIIARNVGEEQLFEEALESLGQDVYRMALDEAEVEPYAPGALEEIVNRAPLILRYTVPLAPKVELGDYQAVRLDYEPPEVSDESVDQVMEELRQGQALIEPTDRPAQLTDVVVLDVRGVLPGEGDQQSRTLMDEKNVSVLVDEETDWPVPGVAEHLVGLQAGDETSFEYTFPDDYANENLRGETANFALNCLEVKTRFVPKWSDDLARNLGDFDDLLALRMQVRENLSEESERRADNDYAQKVIETVVEGADVEYPPVLLEQEIDGMLGDLRRRLESQNLSLDDYLKIEQKSEEDLRQELQPDAEARLKRALVLGKVVDVEDIQVNQEEVDAELDEMVEPLEGRAGEIRKRLDNPGTRRHIELDLLTSKAIRRLVEIARGEPQTAEHAAAEIRPEEGTDGEPSSIEAAEVIDNKE